MRELKPINEIIGEWLRLFGVIILFGVIGYCVYMVLKLQELLPSSLTNEIRLTELVKPVKMYDDLEVSDFQFNKIYPSNDNISGNKTYVIEYSVNIKNNGEPLITIDDPDGKLPLTFNEELIFREIDGIEGKEEYGNFGDILKSDLLTKSGEKIIYSTNSPINTNDEFKCIGKIVMNEDTFNDFLNRDYKSFLYISFGGTTKEMYSDSNGFGFVIKQDDFEVNLSDFLKNNFKK